MKIINYFILFFFAPLGVLLMIYTNEVISLFAKLFEVNITREDIALSYLLLGIITINALVLVRRKNKNVNNI